jgi:hypothetical protein
MKNQINSVDKSGLSKALINQTCYTKKLQGYEEFSSIYTDSIAVVIGVTDDETRQEVGEMG